jgi:hypothetical protein
MAPRGSEPRSAHVEGVEGGDKVKETALFVGWGGTYPGRERSGLHTYHEWIRILDEAKDRGEIEDWQSFVLAPHGGELDGFTLVFAEPVKLMQLTEREDVQRLRMHAVREQAKFSMIFAFTGERIEQDFKLLEEEILPEIERVPVAV